MDGQQIIVTDEKGVKHVFPPGTTEAQMIDALAGPLVSPTGTGYAHDAGMREGQMPQARSQAATAIGTMAASGAGLLPGMIGRAISVPAQAAIQSGIGAATGLAADGSSGSALGGAITGGIFGAAGAKLGQKLSLKPIPSVQPSTEVATGLLDNYGQPLMRMERAAESAPNAARGSSVLSGNQLLPWKARAMMNIAKAVGSHAPETMKPATAAQTSPGLFELLLGLARSNAQK